MKLVYIPNDNKLHCIGGWDGNKSVNSHLIYNIGLFIEDKLLIKNIICKILNGFPLVLIQIIIDFLSFKNCLFNAISKNENGKSKNSKVLISNNKKIRID